jgi:hypothetical protein
MTPNEREGLCQSLATIALACEQVHADITEAPSDKAADVAAYTGLFTLQHMVAQLLQALTEAKVITTVGFTHERQ